MPGRSKRFPARGPSCTPGRLVCTGPMCAQRTRDRGPTAYRTGPSLVLSGTYLQKEKVTATSVSPASLIICSAPSNDAIRSSLSLVDEI